MTHKKESIHNNLSKNSSLKQKYEMQQTIKWQNRINKSINNTN